MTNESKIYTRSTRTRFTLAGIPLLFCALYPLQVRIDRQIGSVEQQKEEMVFRSPRLVRAMCLGYESFFADLYWTRAVQYYGGKRRDHDPHFDLLGGLLDLTTTLDPHLIVVYKFGGVFLAQKAPQGAGRPDLAVDLIRRGIAENPEEWRLWADLGFVYYWDMRNYKKASEAYLEGSRHPGASMWMKPMAAQLAAQGGSREVSSFLWSEIHKTTTNDIIRKNALEHIQTLKAEDDGERLENVIADFKKRYGRPPLSIWELVTTKLLPGYPADPAGFPYLLGPGAKPMLDPASPINSEMLKPQALP